MRSLWFLAALVVAALPANAQHRREHQRGYRPPPPMVQQWHQERRWQSWQQWQAPAPPVTYYAPAPVQFYCEPWQGYLVCDAYGQNCLCYRE